MALSRRGPLDLLRDFGTKDYLGEVGVTQASHMLQAAELASKETGDPHTILAALFHDVGHLLVFENPEAFDGQDMKGYGLKSHENLGADYLAAMGFPPEIYEPVRLHVDAKRYLCSVDSSYFARLSKASQVTFGYQGGGMSGEEVEAFRAHPFFEEAIRLRFRDDAAKVPDDTYVFSTSLDDYEELVKEVLKMKK